MVQDEISLCKCQIRSLYYPLVMKAIPEGGGRHLKQNIIISIKQEIEKGLGNSPKGS